MLAVINQMATPMKQGDIVEVLNKYEDKTVLGGQLYSVRVVASDSKDVEAGEIRLIVCYKVDIFDFSKV